MLPSLAWVLALAAATPALPVASRWPERFQVDGELDEWTGQPFLKLGAANQIAGPSRVASPYDFTAKVWAAFSDQGLAVAGEVTDDVFVPARSADQVQADHAEIWLSFPGQALPPIGFANQFGEIRVKEPADCRQEGIEDADACVTWLRAQKQRRLALGRLFTRQYVVTLAGLDEVWSKSASDAALPLDCCTRSQSVLKPITGGWRFEVRIAPEDLPLTRQLPLEDVRIAVDFADADQGGERLETFLSSVPGRKLGRPETFQAVKLTPGLRFESTPPLLQAMQERRKGLFYAPGHPVPHAYALLNPVKGYQYTPTEPSPAVREITLGKLTPIAEKGKARLFRVKEPEGDDWLWATLDDRPVSQRVQASGRPEGTAVRPIGTDLLFVQEGSLSRYGTGACGGCPRTQLEVVRLDGAGKLETVFKEAIQEQVELTEGDVQVSYDNVTAFARPDLSEMGFAGTRRLAAMEGVTGSAADTEQPFRKVWRWNEKELQYRPVQDAKSHPASVDGKPSSR